MLRTTVSTGERRGLTNQGGTGSAQAFGNEPEALPVGLIREAPAKLAIGLGKILGVASEP